MMLCKKTAMQKMSSKDQAFIEKVCVKKSSNLIGQENFGPQGFRNVVLRTAPPSVKK